MSAQSGKPRFIRVRGRIIPVGVRREKKAAREIVSGKNSVDLLKIGAATAASLGGSFGAGRLQRLSESMKNLTSAGRLNRAAKLLSFGAKALPAIVAGSALASIDKRTHKDEKSRLFNIGNSTGALNVGIGLATGYAIIRSGKRFEKFGLRGGKFPWKLKDI